MLISATSRRLATLALPPGRQPLPRLGDLATLSGDIIRGNSAANGGGVADISRISVSGSTITANAAAGLGGGLFILDDVADGDFTEQVASTTVRRNSAWRGGGIWTADPVQLTGSRITRNDAVTGGGGIFASGTTAAVTLTSSPVTRNLPDNCEPAGTVTGCLG